MSKPIEKKPTPPAGTPERGEPLRQIVAGPEEPASSHLGARLRSYFLTGLIVVGPVAITIYVVWWFITLVDAWVKPLIPPQYLPEHYLPFNVPGVGLIFGITGVMLVGALTANLFGRTLVTYSEMMLARMPIVRNVYRTLKQIFETVLSKNGGSFKRVGLIEFPRHGLYAIVFFAGGIGVGKGHGLAADGHGIREGRCVVAQRLSASQFLFGDAQPRLHCRVAQLTVQLMQRRDCVEVSGVEISQNLVQIA